MSGQVCFDVSLELLAQALALPDGAEIIDVLIVRPNIVQIAVRHPDLPESVGAYAPKVRPIIRADYSKRPSTWLIFDWNLESLRRE